jgi:hypothetical protein
MASYLIKLMGYRGRRSFRPTSLMALTANPTPLRPPATRRWTDARCAPDGDFTASAIPDAALTVCRVPEHGDSWDAVFDFALTYDGYAYWDGLAELANRTVQRWTRDRSLPDDLGELRACLFHEQRRWHHFGDDPAGRSAQYMWALVGGIRQCVIEATSSTGPLADPRPKAAPEAHVRLLAPPGGEARPAARPAAWVYRLHPASTRVRGATVGGDLRPMPLVEALPKPSVIVARPRPGTLRTSHPAAARGSSSLSVIAGRVSPVAADGAAPHRVVFAGALRTSAAGSHGGGVTSFLHDDARYGAWLGSHPDGFVLNGVRKGSKTPGVLHLVGCAALAPTRQHRGSTSVCKLCASTPGALVAWSAAETGGTPRSCRRCLP